MEFSRGKLAFVVVAVAIGGGVAFWLTRPTEPPVRRIRPNENNNSTTSGDLVKLTKPKPPAGGYVGSESCRECHEKVFDTYQSHPMSQSAATAVAASPMEDYTDKTTFEIPGRVHYRVERTGNEVLHHEIKRDADGAVIYDQKVPVHYAVGSGRRGRTYLIERDGMLFESPITWYSARKRWDLSPGYSFSSNKRFERRIADGCVYCHFGRVNFDRERAAAFKKPVVLEASIGCERCHGPGRAHIAHRRKGMADGERDPIVNPGRLAPRARDAVCNQCHLQGETRLLRYGRSDFDFRPGDQLEDIWTIFVGGTRVGKDGRTAAVSQVQQMHASKCFQKSEGRMGCISCHDPHRVPKPAERVTFYRSRCHKCHAEAGDIHCAVPLAKRTAAPMSNSCIACHMPRLATSDVPHTSQTDHRVIRTPAAAKRQTEETAARLFNNGASRLPAADVKRARGLYLVGRAERLSDAALATRGLQLLRDVLPAAPNDLAMLTALGSASRIRNEPEQAREYWERGLEIDPDNEQLLRSLAILAHDNKNDKQGIAYLDRYFQLNRWHADLYGRHAHMLGRIGRLKPGITSARRSLELNPGLYNVHGWLENAYKTQGDVQRSAYHRKMRNRLLRTP